MKRMFLFLSALFATSTCIYADDYPYLTFQTTDGAQTSFSAVGLTLTLEDGLLVVSDGTTRQTFAPETLAQMFFAQSGANAIGSITTDEAATTCEVYTLAGIHIGSFASRAALRGQLPAGIYLVKTKDTTTKLVVK